MRIADQTPNTSTSTERRYGGRTAQERREERRERLLDAGLQLFGTIGFQATTIEALCAAASLNARYFYEQFRSREELLGAVYERHVQQVLVKVRAAIESEPEAPARLQAGLRAFIDATLADELGARVNYFEMIGVSPALEQLRRRVLSDYAELVISQANYVRTAGDGDERMTAIALVGAIDGLISDWFAGDRARPQSALFDTLMAIFGPAIN